MAGPSTAGTAHGNFLKGVKWSPDGSCLLTASDDNWLRIFDLPQNVLYANAHGDAHGDASGCQGTGSRSSSGQGGSSADSLSAGLRVQEGETIYDYAWYSRMTVTDAASCCFASSSRGHPIHLWDACGGSLRATYRGFNAVDEVAPAYSLCFSRDGQKLFAGYPRGIYVFDVNRPGRQYRKIETHKKHQDCVPGIISCMDFSPDGNTFAAGSYGKVVGLYDSRSHDLTLTLSGHTGGLTQVMFSKDGNYLYSGARQDPHILCWDVRFNAGEVYRMARATATTNQRVHFHVEPCGRHLATGGAGGAMKVFDLRTGTEVLELHCTDDTINGLEFHPYMPLIATASGQRQYPLQPATDSDSDEEHSKLEQ
ncbi:MAG: hypothetical protein WDW36_006041 [Sanguina aurantia]